MPDNTLIIDWLRGGVRLPLLVGAGVLVVYGLVVADPYGQRLLTVAGCYALMVLGYQFIFGHAGALSLAQGSFFGLGAYVTGILGSQLGWSFPLTFPLSIALPVVLAAVIALPVLRLESHYFALATLGIGQVVWLAAVNWEAVTGGANGLPGVPGIVAFGLAVPRGAPLLVFVWILVAFGAALAVWRTAGLAGRRFEVMREDPILAGALGINTGWLRFQALLLSAAFGGAAGALQVHTIGVISPESLAFPMMVAALTMTVVGGRLHVAGAIVGALLLVHVPEWARVLEDWRLVVYGVAMLAMIVAAPDGLLGLAAGLRARLWPEAPPPPPPAVPPVSAARAETGAVLLQIGGLTKHFGGVAAVDGVDLELSAGQVFGLIGPNGSGKTTLVNLITGIERPGRGRILFRGTDIAGQPSWRIAGAGIARTFQASRLVPGMTVLDAVAIAGFRSVEPDRAKGHAMALLAACGLSDFAALRCGALAPGSRRRLEVARALALDPALLILDEPAAGLDRDARAALTRLVRTLAAEGRGILIIEHDLDFLAPLADRMGCLHAGRLIATGAPADVRAHPAVRAAYLGVGTRGEDS